MADIGWREWSSSSFREARRRQVPVLLSIVSPWFDACRRMDISTYSDSRVVTFVEGNLVPIRVDALDRPDLVSRYAHSLPPVTAFLTPDGHLLTAAGFLDAAQLLSAIERVVLYYRDNKAQIEREVAERERRALLASEPQNPITPGAVRRVEESILRWVESELSLKLAPDAVHLLHLRYWRTGSEVYSGAIRKLLTSWASSPLFDKVDGGFFHHVSKPDFSDLELSKTCADNAGAIEAYAVATKLYNGAQFDIILRQTCRWVSSTLLDERTGGFFAGQLPDADYYVKGRRGHAARPRALAKIYVAPCAAMARALIDAALVTGERELGRRALSAGELLWRECYDPNSGMAHRLEPLLAERKFGFLTDQLSMLDLLLRIYEVGGHPLHLQRAVELGGLIEALYEDPQGGFYDRTPEEDDIGHLKFRKKSAVENGRVAMLFYKLGALTHNDHFKEVAAAALWRFTSRLDELGPIAAQVALACDVHLGGITEAVVIGSRDNPAASRLRIAVLELFSPAVALGTIDPTDESTLRIRDVTFRGKPVGYVFHGGERLGPIEHPEEFREEVLGRVRGK